MEFFYNLLYYSDKPVSLIYNLMYYMNAENSLSHKSSGGRQDRITICSSSQRWDVSAEQGKGKAEQKTTIMFQATKPGRIYVACGSRK